MTKLASIDKKRVINAFNKAATQYDKVAQLQQTVAIELISLLSFSPATPITILDIGSGTGYLLKLLNKKFSQSQIIAIDIASQMLEINKAINESSQLSYLCTDTEKLALDNNVADLIISNMALHWCNNLEKTLQELHRVLKAGGHIHIATLGPKTLYELRECWQLIDNNQHVNDFIKPTTLKSLLIDLKFKNINIETNIVHQQYKTVYDIMKNLKTLGASNNNFGRPKTLVGKQKFKQLAYHYEKFRNDKNQLPVSYEVIYVTGEK